MPANQAQALVEYLRANPAAARQAYEQAQTILRNPAMAQAFSNMTVRPQPPPSPVSVPAALARGCL